jgi:selenocysteine lyase/cysteine desulfurase
LIPMNPYKSSSVEALRAEIVGIDQEVPLLDGSRHPYVYLDNAASTPALRGVQNKVNELMEMYSSIHRGSGFKSWSPPMPTNEPGKLSQASLAQTQKRIA